MSLLREDDEVDDLPPGSGQLSHHPSAVAVSTASVMHGREGQREALEVDSMSRDTREHAQKRQQPKRRRVSYNTSHPCHICGKTYDRVDHLSRHLKSRAFLSLLHLLMKQYRLAHLIPVAFRPSSSHLLTICYKPPDNFFLPLSRICSDTPSLQAMIKTKETGL